MCDINKMIEEKRIELDNIVYSHLKKGLSLTNKEVIKVSREMDELINLKMLMEKERTSPSCYQ